ncbi:cytochrome P450 oxidoreductase [Microthyrium microscopicum]|uniref:Cytochrome P450 oxidoreductase n=1 Tax=Microthyrium microscopicum TaxID=703497 RepID=A0A6A6UA79_9PEZI|nr:cytochrome P450 oxidoreductase [Microthyrium microscopicum]
MFVQLFSIFWRYWSLIVPTTFITYFVSNKYRYGLAKYPGPWLAAYTDWWRFFDACGRQSEKTFQEIHRKYGDIVRIGPNVLSFADPQALKQIYGLNKGFVKSDFYPVQQASVEGRRLPSLFSTVDEGYHARYRRCVNGAFSMSSLVPYEPLVESTLAVFLKQTEKLFQNTGKTCNLTRWVQFFAFDVIGELTWSKRVGFLERNEDVDGIIDFVSSFLDYAGPIGQMPILDLLLKKNVIRMQLQRWGLWKTTFPATQFALDRQAERENEMNIIKQKGIGALKDVSQAESQENRGIDLLSKFTQAQFEHPEIMTNDMVLTTSLSMVIAGSETTAISLSAVLYYLLQNPRTYSKLLAEIDQAVLDGIIENREDCIVSWTASQKLPYLDAVIQEAFRLHPAAGLILERIVPAQGIEIMGERIPGGTIVGCNAWVLHRRREVFGEDVETFRPERWLEAAPKQLREMKATMFQFGAGARTCIGKNISLLEIYKLVPSLLRRFQLELVEPEREWTTLNAWFVRQLDFNVKFLQRQK